MQVDEREEEEQELLGARKTEAGIVTYQTGLINSEG